MFVGSAPMTPQILINLRLVLGIPIQEAYGLSETAAPATMQLESDFSIGNVGIPLSNCELKLQDVPEMEYFSTSNPP